MKKWLLSIFVAVSVLACVAGGVTTINTTVSASSTPVFTLHEGVQMKTTAEGMRWRLQMDETYFNKASNENATVGVLHFPSVLVKNVTDFSNYKFVEEITGANAPLNNVIDKDKIYYDEDTQYYIANACVTSFVPENRTLDYMSVGYIKINGVYEYSTIIDNDISLYSRNIYSVVNSALMTQKYNDSIKTNYTWFGTESYPITISTAEEYTKIVDAIKKDSDLLTMTYRIDNVIALPDGTEKLPSEIKLTADSKDVVISKNVTIAPIESGKLNMPITIVASSTDLENAELIYTVTAPNGENVTLDENATFVPTMRGTYTVKVEINDGTYYGVSEQTVEVKKAGELVDFTTEDCVDNFTVLYRNDITSNYTEISYAENYNGKNAVKFVRDTTDTTAASTRINLRSNWTVYELQNAAKNNEFDGISVSIYLDDVATQDYVLWIWGNSAVTLGTIKAGSWQQVFIPKQQIINTWGITDATMNTMAAAYNVTDGGHNFLVIGKGTAYGTPATCPIYVSGVDFVKEIALTTPDSVWQGSEVSVDCAPVDTGLENVIFTYTIIAPNGDNVALTDSKFTANQVGNYTVLAEMSGAYTGYAQKNVTVLNTTLLDCTTDSRISSAFARTKNMTITYETDIKGTGRSGFKFVPAESGDTRVNVNFDLTETELKALMNNEEITGIELDIYFDGAETADYTVYTWVNSAKTDTNTMAVKGGKWQTVYITKERLVASIGEGYTVDDWCVRFHSTSTASIGGGLFDMRASKGWGSASKVDFYISAIRAVNRPVA